MRVWWIKPLEKKNQNQLFYRTNKAVGLINQAPTEEKPYKKGFGPLSAYKKRGGGVPLFLDIEDTKQKGCPLSQEKSSLSPFYIILGFVLVYP